MNCIPVCQIFLRTARCSYEAIIALALHCSVILIVGNADFIGTTRRTVCLTGTLYEIIIDILAFLEWIDVIIIRQGSSGIYWLLGLLKFRRVGSFSRSNSEELWSNQPCEQGEDKLYKLNPLIRFKSIADTRLLV